jgi:phage tail protein X
MVHPFLSKKIVFALAIFIGIGSLILLARIFLENRQNQHITRIPIGTSPGKDRIVLVFPEVKKEGAKTAGQEEAGVRLQGPLKAPRLQNPVLPAANRNVESKDNSSIAKQNQVSRSRTMAEKSPVSALSREGKTETGSKEKRPVDESGRKGSSHTVIVQKGDSIYSIAARIYHIANTSIVERILSLNPKIKNPDKLLIRTKIKLPRITEGSLVIKSSDGPYQIRLGTFLRPEYSDFLKAHPALQGKAVFIIPWKTLFGETWYRANAGNFDTSGEGLEMVRALREEGLSPYFQGFKFQQKN